MSSLRAWRQTKFKTQGDAAKKLGLPRGTYQTYEAGSRTIPPEVQSKLKGLGYKGEFKSEDEAVTRAELDAAVARLEGLIHWGVEELRKGQTALGAAHAVALAKLAELEEKLKA